MHKKFFINAAYRQNIQSGIDKSLAVTYNKPIKSTIQLPGKKGKGLRGDGIWFSFAMNIAGHLRMRSMM